MLIEAERPTCGSVYQSNTNVKREFRRLHKYHTRQYMLSIEHDLDSMAQSKSRHFWKTIKNRKAKQQSYCAIYRV